MTNVSVQIDGKHIATWDGFHETFSKVLGFPDHYGRNMNAWIDCMTSLDDPHPQSDMRVKEGEILLMSITSADHLKHKAPEIWDALNECAAFVNYRRIEKGDPPVLALSYHV